MKDCKIAFLGGGNMALSLIGGLIADGFDPDHIYVADPEPQRLVAKTQSYPVQTFHDNLEAIQHCHVVIAAVKPQQLQSLVKQLSAHWQTGTLLLPSQPVSGSTILHAG